MFSQTIQTNENMHIWTHTPQHTLLAVHKNGSIIRGIFCTGPGPGYVGKELCGKGRRKRGELAIVEKDDNHVLSEGIHRVGLSCTGKK